MDENPVNRILVVRIDFLGDMVCTTPLLHELKSRWPYAELHVLANKYNSPVLENNSDISMVHHYVYSKNQDKNVRPGFLHYLKDRFMLIYQLRKLKFDLLVIPNGGMNKNAINFAKQLNVPDCRWHNSDTEYDDRVQSHVNTRPRVHEVLSGFSLVPELGHPDINRLSLRVFPRKELVLQWQKVLGKGLKPRVGFFVSNNSADRRWPWNKWQKLINVLTGRCEVIVFHSPQEIFPSEWHEGHGVHRITTRTVPDLIAAMTYLDVVVSADSAPVHLASALKIPLVALFESRPEKYQRWYPLGVKNILLHEGKSVGDISFEPVFSAIIKLLNDEKTGALNFKIAN